MSENDEKTRIVRPLEQLQRAANPDTDDSDETRKVERDDAKDTKIQETTKTKNAMPQFRVTSVKNLADSCTP